MKRAVVVAAIVLAGAGSLAVRVILEGRAALAEGDEAHGRQRPADAIAAWETAAALTAGGIVAWALGLYAA